ncbi:MAG: hypothetical protein ABI388_10670 [Bacteroidia bacterium]
MLKQCLYISLACVLPFFVFAQRQKAGEPKLCYTRISFGPAIGLYSNNTFHTANTRPGVAIGASVLEEVHLYKTVYFVGGLEYMYNSLSFNSYYFEPGYQYLYNGKFDYNYTLKMQEARVNLMLRFVAGDETKNNFTAYLETGYVLRCLLNTQMQVVSDLTGDKFFTGTTTRADYQGKTIKGNFSSGFKINGGLQHNYLRSHRAWFIQLTYMQGLAGMLVHEDFMPASIIIKSAFIQLGLGYKF